MLFFYGINPLFPRKGSWNEQTGRGVCNRVCVVIGWIERIICT